MNLWPEPFNYVHTDPRGRWWTSAWNADPAAAAQIRLPDRVVVKDDTLREGILAPGAGGRGGMTLADRVEIARALEGLGITEAEVGYTVRLEETVAVLHALKAAGVQLKCSIHTKVWGDLEQVRQDIATVLDAGADMINLLLLWDQGGRPEHEYRQQVREGVRFAKSRGAYVAFGTTQLHMRPEFYRSLCQEALDAGVDRIVAYDGHGCTHVTGFKTCVAWIRDWLDPKVPIEVHCHNDMGIGTAQILAAVEAGAEIVDVSVNGLGNRAGIGTLEEVVTALTVLYGLDLGLRLEQLYPLSRLVQEKTGIPVQQHKPVVGEAIAIHESAVHIQQIITQGAHAWEVYKPELVGQKSQLVFGSTSLENNFTALKVVLRHHGMAEAEDRLTELVAAIRQRLQTQRYVTEAEVVGLGNRLLGR